MSYQEPNQSPFGPPPQQQPDQSGWGQQSQQGTWGQPGAPVQEQQQQQGWGSQQAQIPQQPNYPNAAGYGQQQFNQPQDYVPGQQQFQQQPGYGQGPGYATGPQGYMPQTDFGSGAGYGPGYPPPNQGNSTLATVALWLGVFTGFGLINLVIAIMAINETGPGKKQGRNKAVIGLILTIVWSVIWVGAAVALTSHAKNQIAAMPAAPTTVATAAANPGTGATAGATSTGEAVEQANSSSSDPGCQAAQSAFNTYNKNAISGGLPAMRTLAGSLESASGQSQVASSQLKAVGDDFTELSHSTTPSTIVTDMESLDTACDMTFDFTG